MMGDIPFFRPPKPTPPPLREIREGVIPRLADPKEWRHTVPLLEPRPTPICAYCGNRVLLRMTRCEGCGAPVEVTQ